MWGGDVTGRGAQKRGFLQAHSRISEAEVWRRDEGRCTERGFLEYHHVQPYAAGGVATTANIELRCRTHNAYEASLFFGCESDRTGAVRRRERPQSNLADHIARAVACVHAGAYFDHTGSSVHARGRRAARTEERGFNRRRRQIEGLAVAQFVP